MIVYGWTDANLQSSTNKGGLLLLLLRRLPTFELHRGSATGIFISFHLMIRQGKSPSLLGTL